MNISVFLNNHKIKTVSADTLVKKHAVKQYFLNSDLIELFENYGGSIVDEGIFRIYNSNSSFFWTEIVENYFPEYRGKFILFGFDWMGRQFGISLSNENPTIYMFDHATGEAFEMQADLSTFFNEDLTLEVENTLSVSIFDTLKEMGLHNGLRYFQILAYKKPLFLAGSDSDDNYVVEDVEINWEINYQLFCKLRNLPEKQLINRVTIN